MKRLTPLVLSYFLFATSASAQWSLTGNAVTSTNFLGTTNGQAILFKANGTMVGQLQYGSGANVSFGVSAGNGWNTLCCNVAIGANSLQSNTSSNNTGVGYNTLASCTTGEENTAIGSGVAAAITTGQDNCALGSYTMNNLTTGSYNCAYGPGSLISLISGGGNSAYGYLTLNQNTAYYNSAFGFQSLYSNTSGSPNSAFGYQCLVDNTTGANNAAFGNSTLANNTTGSDNTAIGAYSGPASGYTNLSNTGCFGYGATVSASNNIQIGNSSITFIGGAVQWTNESDARVKKNVRENVPGLAFIKLLRPVTYNFDETAVKKIKDPQSLIPISAADKEAMASKEAITYTGFLAQEVETAAKKLNYDFSGVCTPVNDQSLYGLRYAEFVVPLVKAVQEVSGTTDSLINVIDSLKNAQANLQAQINNLAQQMAQLKSSAALDQNIPNPFKGSTTINYNLPAGTNDAQLTITDAAGRVLKDVVLGNLKGPGQAVVNAGDLAAGTYFYSLVVNGKIVKTKRMILTR
jgi:hypothetical protein